MMSVAEATNSNGTVLGAIVTFVLYGLLPIALMLYFMGAPGRKRAIRAREQRLQLHSLTSSQMQAAWRPLTRSRRWEKKRSGLPTVHQGALPSLPNTCVTPKAARRWRASAGKSASHLPPGSG